MLNEPVLLWHARSVVGGRTRDLRCTAEQLGEGYFELRLRSGREVLLTETFENTEDLARRAETLRAGQQPTRPARPGVRR